MTPVIYLTTIICLVVILIIVIHLIITQIFLMILIIATMTIIVTVTIAKLWTTIIRKTIVLLQINIKEVIADLIIKLTKLRLQLVKSLVIVICFFETEMRDAVIINYCFIAVLQGKAVAKCRSCSVDGQLIESRKFYI